MADCRRVARAWTRIAPLPLLACLTACAVSYVEPDPVTTPTARISVKNPKARNPLARVATTVLHVYAVKGTCDPGAAKLGDAYQGSIDVDRREREFRVVADRQVFLRLAHLEQDDYGSATCRGTLGFLPRTNETYTLDLRVDRLGLCTWELRRQDAVVELLDPADCFASGW